MLGSRLRCGSTSLVIGLVACVASQPTIALRSYLRRGGDTCGRGAERMMIE